VLQVGREHQRGRPHQPEQRPRGRRNAEPLGGAERIGELLPVQQRSNDGVDAADGDGFGLGPV